MKLEQRSYGGKIFRPKPIVHLEDDLLVLATCWGSGDHTPKVIDEVVKYVTAATGDVEVTTPFERLSGLSDAANFLRIACLLANDYAFRNENKSEYNAGYELLALHRSQSQLSWAQVGGPHVLLKKPKKPVQPVALQQDHWQLPPLPTQLLGLDHNCQVYCGDFKVQSQDQIILASSGLLPSALWMESAKDSVHLQQVTQWLVQENPDSPFWLGLIQI